MRSQFAPFIYYIACAPMVKYVLYSIACALLQLDMFYTLQPVLCYMEGMWTEADGDKIDEPFASDRHSIAAESFFDLQVKVLSLY